MSYYLDDKWIKEALIKRKSQFSLVSVFETKDPKRLTQFLKFVLSRPWRKRGSTEIPAKVYIFFDWRGLFKVTLRDGQIHYDPVSPISPQSDNPFVRMISTMQQTQTIMDLNVALRYIDSLFRTDENIVFVIVGLFKPHDSLTSAVRSWVFDDTLYPRGHFVAIFVEDAKMLFDDMTLQNLIVVKVPYSTNEEREFLISNIAREFRSIVGRVNINGIVQATKGLTLHETESVILESIYKFKSLRYDVVSKFKNEMIRKSEVVEIVEPEYGFEAIGGYDYLKEFIKLNIIKVLRNPEKARRLGLRPPRGLLLFGMPGTGKTLFAKALAKELEIPFLEMKTENIVSSLYGETERNMAKALRIADEVAPCILFIDEVDRFGRRTGIETDSGTTRRTFSVFLSWLGKKEREAIVVATTNRPEDLDEAFIRVGRFDYIIPVLLPDYKARVEILKVHTQVVRKVALAPNVNLEVIASKTELFTGAELEELVIRAGRHALKMDKDRVDMSDFEYAIQTFKINESERRRQLKRYIDLAEKFCNDVEFMKHLTEHYSNMVSRIEALKEEMGL